MFALATDRRFSAHRGMALPTEPKRGLTEAQALGLALRSLRKRVELTQEQAAERAGVVETSWRRYEKGQRELSFDQLAKLAEAVGSDREHLLIERAKILGEPLRVAHSLSRPMDAPATIVVRSQLLTVRDRVQAGAWLAADDFRQDAPRSLPVVKDQRFPHADQWLSEVSGDSVNLLSIFDGDFVQCVDAIAISYSPKRGDLVEVERLRFGGSERELTLKQVEIGEDGTIELWPRSSNQRWQEPIPLRMDVADSEEIEVRVRGLVISVTRRLL